MLTGIANFIFGAASETPSGGECVNLKVTPAENEWVLVDKDGTTVSILAGEDCYDFASSTYPLHDRSNTPSPVKMAALVESWFITPPSCFTAGVPNHLATSPLEDALIEHPSMSVYGGPGAGPRSGGRDLQSSIDDNQNLPVLRRSPRHSHVTAKAGILAQVQSFKMAQRVQHRQNTRKLTGKQLKRANQACSTTKNQKKLCHTVNQPTARTANRKC